MIRLNPFENRVTFEPNISFLSLAAKLSKSLREQGYV